jgi:hypothetical protein
MHVWNSAHWFLNSNLSDDDHIGKRHNDFLGQLNNNLCCSEELHSHVQYKLLPFYFSSRYYSGKLWHLANPDVDGFCAAWRKGLRRIIPSTIVCCLLSVIASLFSTKYAVDLLILLALVLHVIILSFSSSPLME